ncbi:protein DETOXIFICATION 14-like isoform X2 [Henckelia pumila]|uniref:protein DETOXIFICATION 14-like isoform X2 n=1 Tax=Henckelia pumila TaxID=405737 RepID=UPI003C6E4AF3
MENTDRITTEARFLWQPWKLLFSDFPRVEYTSLEQSTQNFFGNMISSRGKFLREANRVNFIAWPMIVVTVSQFVLRLSPMFMLGHLSELSLSSASIAITFCNVTGFSVVFGMASALETLCGQAYGAEQYSQVGTYAYAAVVCLFMVCLPVSLLWIYTQKLLEFMGQDHLISEEAGKFAVWLIPSLFPYAILQSLTRYLQTQSLILPMLVSSVATLLINLPLCWAFVFKLKLGNTGAAVSIGLSYWINVIFLGFYVKYSCVCSQTRASFSKDVFGSFKDFFQYAIPSATMVCLEWWSFEIVSMFSGLLQNPQLEMSVLSICMTITSLHFNIPYSFGAAASTRISNELGAGNPQAARVALQTALILAVTEFILAAIAISICGRVLGFVFTREEELILYIQRMAPLISLSIVMDSLQAILSGVARGGGWQQIGAYVNLGSYYLVGIPVALVMGFVLHLNGKGLWIGLVIGAAVQCFLFSIVTYLTDWDKQLNFVGNGSKTQNI